MDSSDNVKQKPNQSTETSLEASKHTPPAKNLLVKHSWLLFVGLFGISVGVGTFGYYELNYIGDVPKKEAEKPSKVVSAELITKFTDTSNATPSWLIIAIALTCAAGCWVIFRLFKLP
ncbi:hypothetical protein VB713_09330 [Anabaena cylindrica UHCC 0172]|uniref:hypothetical protein n=1 Tax=Anabaena cylindrica TaxID=1165 RepID=UPI002B1E9989|nr:hypothetical protein [Anabaena cylindrica]MEA5551172.1 hypothetical protein [Anabaena cylindrica UHCC 0172]